MKKSILSVMITFLFLTHAYDGDASYLIQLKNGGEFITTKYWIEGNQVVFFYGSGAAGIERTAVERVELSEKKPIYRMDTTSENKQEKELPTPSLITEKTRKTEKPPVTDATEEKVNITDYKNKKDRLTLELEELLNKRRDALERKDKEAYERLTERITNTSSEIYKITGEATAKNKGKLPEGWWKR
jgi:hypothetical protein